jgi:hypothetical protein
MCFDFFADTGKDIIGRQHSSLVVRAINAKETAVPAGLLKINAADFALEVEVGLVDVLFTFKVGAVSALALMGQALFDKVDGDVQIEVKLWPRKVKLAVFGVEYPFAEIPLCLFVSEFRALVGYVGIDIAVQQHGGAAFQRFAYLRSGPVAVFGEEKGDQLGMYFVDGPELPAEEAADESAIDSGFVAGEMDIFEFRAFLSEVFAQEPDLSGFPGPIKAFKYN